MRVGTKSILFGAHCFFLHPFFVAWAWWRLYGFPTNWRLWLAFVVHDLGYWGLPNMDGPEGERHVETGAWILRFCCDDWRRDRGAFVKLPDGKHVWFGSWGLFSLCHSRYYAKAIGQSFSRLCVADKLAFCLTPWWLYLPMTWLTGELQEYPGNAELAESDAAKRHGLGVRLRARDWHRRLSSYMRDWVETHKTGAADTWTNADRHGSPPSTVPLAAPAHLGTSPPSPEAVEQLVQRFQRVTAPSTVENFRPSHGSRSRVIVPAKPRSTRVHQASDGEYSNAEQRAIARLKSDLAAGRTPARFKLVRGLAVGSARLSLQRRALIDTSTTPWRLLEILCHEDYDRRLNQIRSKVRKAGA